MLNLPQRGLLSPLPAPPPHPALPFLSPFCALRVSQARFLLYFAAAPQGRQDSPHLPDLTGEKPAFPGQGGGGEVSEEAKVTQSLAERSLKPALRRARLEPGEVGPGCWHEPLLFSAGTRGRAGHNDR